LKPWMYVMMAVGFAIVGLLATPLWFNALFIGYAKG
jgi:hypothetical protein